MGLKPDQNLFVTSEGKWRTRYIPAHLRGHPFYLTERAEDKYVVSVDEDSGLIGDKGELMFEDGKPTHQLQQVIDFLVKLAKERAITDNACAVLDKYGLIEPWEGYGGLYRIKENQLKELSGEALVRLRDTGGLKIMYGQLYSMTQVGMLRKLAEEEKEPDIEQLFGEDATLNFDNI